MLRFILFLSTILLAVVVTLLIRLVVKIESDDSIDRRHHQKMGEIEPPSRGIRVLRLGYDSYSDVDFCPYSGRISHVTLFLEDMETLMDMVSSQGSKSASSDDDPEEESTEFSEDDDSSATLSIAVNGKEFVHDLDIEVLPRGKPINLNDIIDYFPSIQVMDSVSAELRGMTSVRVSLSYGVS